MIFKDELKIKGAKLRRGEHCLFRSVAARYMSSFKMDHETHWNHILMVQQIMAGEIMNIEEFLVTVSDTNDICFRNMMPKNIEEQMQLC